MKMEHSIAQTKQELEAIPHPSTAPDACSCKCFMGKYGSGIFRNLKVRNNYSAFDETAFDEKALHRAFGGDVE